MAVNSLKLIFLKTLVSREAVLVLLFLVSFLNISFGVY